MTEPLRESNKYSFNLPKRSEFEPIGFTFKVVKAKLYDKLPPGDPVLWPPKAGSTVYSQALFGGFYRATVDAEGIAVTEGGTRILFSRGSDGTCEVNGHITKEAWEMIGDQHAES